MFTDEKTLNVIHADLDCTVIHGTFRNCDLIPAFLDVIQDTPEYLQICVGNNSNLQVIFDPSATEWDERWETADCDAMRIELEDLCDMYAPDGYYFGAHIGDGSDFGYWKCEE